jgi:urease accessory protein
MDETWKRSGPCAASSLALVRLLRLASPALPVGAFGYSQGLETAIRLGWVSDEASLERWVTDVLTFNLSSFEAVMLARLHAAWAAREAIAVHDLNERVLAARESAELRAEAVQMGSALRTLFDSTAEFEPAWIASLRGIDRPAFATAFAFAAAAWRIDVEDMTAGYLFAWTENQVSAAMKSMRLGHIAGQRILSHVALAIATCVRRSRQPSAALSNFTPALAIASSMHETQNSRVFRS